MTTETMTKLETPDSGLSVGELSVISSGTISPSQMVDMAENAIQGKFQPTSSISEKDIQAAMAEIDLDRTNSITLFGASAADQATAVSQQMLDGVRNKDVGPVGDIMSGMMLQFKGLDPDSINGNWLTRKFKSIESRVLGFKMEFEEVNDQVAGMVTQLETHQTILMTDVAKLDRLYDATVVQFNQLEIYIVAGENMLDILNDTNIPEMQKIVEAGEDGADGTPSSLMPQQFADLQNKRDQLERKVHDLKLVRQVSLMALPQLRQTQDSDNALIGKIGSIKSTTIPLWYQQMAIALSIQNTQKAADATNSVTDATEQMMKDNADRFKVATIAARKSVERSVISIETIQHVNDAVISTLDEVVAITEQGKTNRAAADRILVTQEAALRDALNRTAKSQDDYIEVAVISSDDD